MTRPPAWTALHDLAARSGLVLSGPHPHSSVAHAASLYVGRDVTLTVTAYGADRDTVLRRQIADAIAAEQDRQTAARLRETIERRTGPIAVPPTGPVVVGEDVAARKGRA